LPSHNHTGITDMSGIHSHGLVTGVDGIHGHTGSVTINGSTHFHQITTTTDALAILDSVTNTVTGIEGDSNPNGQSSTQLNLLTQNDGRHQHVITHDNYHNHSINVDGGHQHTFATDLSANGNPHNNIQPTIFIGNVFIYSINNNIA